MCIYWRWVWWCYCWLIWSLAYSHHWGTLFLGVTLWGIHLGMTQGLLAAMVADTAPADLRGTAYGFFNLLSGLGMLLASGLAGFLWNGFGAEMTFYAGAGFCLLALCSLTWQPKLNAILP